MRISGIQAAPFHRQPYSLGDRDSSARCELPFIRAFVDALPESIDAILVSSDLQGFVDADGRTIGLAQALPDAIQRLREGGQLPPQDRTAAILAGDLHARAGEDDVLP